MAPKAPLFPIWCRQFTNFTIFVHYWQTVGNIRIWRWIHAWYGSIMWPYYQTCLWRFDGQVPIKEEVNPSNHDFDWTFGNECSEKFQSHHNHGTELEHNKMHAA